MNSEKSWDYSGVMMQDFSWVLGKITHKRLVKDTIVDHWTILLSRQSMCSLWNTEPQAAYSIPGFISFLIDPGVTVYFLSYVVGAFFGFHVFTCYSPVEQKWSCFFTFCLNPKKSSGNDLESSLRITGWGYCGSREFGTGEIVEDKQADSKWLLQDEMRNVLHSLEWEMTVGFKIAK